MQRIVQNKKKKKQNEEKVKKKSKENKREQNARTTKIFISFLANCLLVSWDFHAYGTLRREPRAKLPQTPTPTSQETPTQCSTHTQTHTHTPALCPGTYCIFCYFTDAYLKYANYLFTRSHLDCILLQALAYTLQPQKRFKGYDIKLEKFQQKGLTIVYQFHHFLFDFEMLIDYNLGMISF